MDQLPMRQLEEVIGQLLQSHAQLRERCDFLELERQGWQQQRREMLCEVESLLSDLELLRGQNL